MAKGDLTLTYHGRIYTFTFAGSAITPSTQVFAVDDIVRFSTTGTLPTGLALDTDYYVVSIGATIEVATSEAGTPIALSGGTGTHSMRVVMSVVFHKFLDGSPPPRETSALSGEGTFSVNGNFIVGGISFEDPQRYTIQAKVSINDALCLQMMYATTDKFRRESGDPFLTLTDEITLFPEEGETAATKTRSSVGTPIQKFGGVFYYPVMQVYMLRDLAIGFDSGVGTVTTVIELQETGVKI